MREANVAPSTLKLSSGTDGNCSCLLAHWIQAATSAALQRRGSAIQSNRFEFNRLFHTFIYLFTSSPIYIWKSFDVINYFEDSYYLAIPNICIRKIQFVRINDTLYVSFFFIDALISSPLVKMHVFRFHVRYTRLLSISLFQTFYATLIPLYQSSPSRSGKEIEWIESS